LAMATPCVAFVAVVVQNGSDEEFVDAFCGSAVEADEVGAGAGVFEVCEELVDAVVVWFFSIWSCHMRLFSVLNPLKHEQGRTWVYSLPVLGSV